MRLDFWNNPIVVSSLRVNFRTHPPTAWAIVYILIQLLIAGAFHYSMMDTTNADEAPRYSAATILSIVSVLSPLIAMLSAQSAMNSEFLHATIDFQRLTPLSPWGVLGGKLAGSMYTSYLLVMSTVPVVFCLTLLGNLSLLSIFAWYANIIGLSALAGSLGLFHSMEHNPDKKRAAPNMMGWIIGGFFFLWFFGMAMQASRLSGFFQRLLELLTPFSLFPRGGAAFMPYDDGFDVLGVYLPLRILTPLLQLTLAALVLVCLVQKFKRPSESPIGKPMAYLLTLIFSLLIAVIAQESLPLTTSMLQSASVEYLTASAILLALIAIVATPLRPRIDSWIWSSRTQPAPIGAWLTDRRTPNLLCMPLCVAIWLGVFYSAFVMRFQRAGAVDSDTAAWLFYVTGVVVAVAVSISAVFQAIALMGTRIGATLGSSLLLLLLGIGPWLLGRIGAHQYDTRPRESVSIVSVLQSSDAIFDGARPGLRAIPFYAVYFAVYLASVLIIFAYIKGRRKLVRDKLIEMGVLAGENDQRASDDAP